MIDKEKVIKGLEWALENMVDPFNDFRFAGYDGPIVILNEPIVRDALALLKAQPAMDAVPVVRCKDCKHWWKVNELCTHQKHVHGKVCVHECKATDYCSDGERRDGE